MRKLENPMEKGTLYREYEVEELKFGEFSRRF
jgi:hypothetical protein